MVRCGVSRTLPDASVARSAATPQVETAICKQGIRGSSPLSSTGQRCNSNNRDDCTAAKYRNRDRREMPHTRSSRASPGCGLECTDPRSWAGIRAAEQEEPLRQSRAPPVRRPAGNVLNLPFQGWFLPLMQRVSERQATQPFSSSDFLGLEDVDGLGDLSGAPGAAAKLGQEVPGLELGVRALAGSAQPSAGGAGCFLRGRFAPARYGVKTCWPAPI